jgi:glutamate racemase
VSVGVFDSGVGGLTVLREIRRALPHEDIVYAADSRFAPYGEKPVEFIRERSSVIVRFLVEQGAKAIVVACNTATAVAVDALRAEFDLPIVAIEPAIKPAVARTTSGVVGVLATSQTLASQRYAALVERFGGGARIVAQACPGLVEQIEKGELTGEETRALVERFVSAPLAQGADTLVLGCTHYGFVSPLIESIAGPGVEILDAALPVAQELRRRLERGGLLTPGSAPGTLQVWSSEPSGELRQLLAQLGLGAVDVEYLQR